MSAKNLDFQQIHAFYRPKIHRYLTRMVGEAEAEDLTQEVFVKISRSLDTFRGESQLSTWIYRIATNVALDRLASASFQRAIQASPVQDLRGDSELELEDRDLRTGEKIPPLDSMLIQKEMYECFQRFVENLSPNYRTVLLLGDLEGLPNNEIADILGLTVEVVKIRLHRARAKLYKELKLHCKPEEWLPEEF